MTVYDWPPGGRVIMMAIVVGICREPSGGQFI